MRHSADNELRICKALVCATHAPAPCCCPVPMQAAPGQALPGSSGGASRTRLAPLVAPGMTENSNQGCAFGDPVLSGTLARNTPLIAMARCCSARFHPHYRTPPTPRPKPFRQSPEEARRSTCVSTAASAGLRSWPSATRHCSSPLVPPQHYQVRRAPLPPVLTASCSILAAPGALG